jgi:arsenate reductase-like glutaredoxin family protein
VIILYTNTNCAWCDKAKEWLAANSIKYKEIPVLEAPEFVAEYKKVTGRSRVGVPILRKGDDIVVGFNEQQYKDLLGSGS